MGWTFRKTHSFGPFKFTLSPKGISTSIGAGPVRITRAADGSLWRTWRIPGTGAYKREKM